MEGDIRSNTDDIQEIFRILKEKGLMKKRAQVVLIKE